MTAAQMDADLAKIDDARIMSNRIDYWERRMKLARLSEDEIHACNQVTVKHAGRIYRVMRAG